MKIDYRFAKISDMDQLIQLRVKMQLEANSFSESDVTDKFIEKVRKYFSHAIDSKKYYGATALEGNIIVGTAGVCFYEKPPSLNSGSGLVGYVTNVYTLPSHRSKGIGTQLMRMLNEKALELKADKLHLGATEDGTKIYRAVGYGEPKFVNLEIKYANLD